MVKDIKIADFTYPLPDDRIARHPRAERDKCRLAVSLPDGTIRHCRFSDLPELLRPDTLMVCNETRVINARMEFHKSTGARIEIFLLSPVEPEDYVLTFQTRERCVWSCMVGNLKKWKDEPVAKLLSIPGVDGEVTLTARRLRATEGNSHEVEFTWDRPEITFASIVEAAGYIPIPPYLQRKSEASDADDYQTVYSRVKGSVAAPTAGLHFTDALFDALRKRGVGVEKVTLHVGAGTFQPVKSEVIGDHPMHTETFSVERSVIYDVACALKQGRTVCAVGTTSVRTLESLAVLGAMLMLDGESLDGGVHVDQWKAYNSAVAAIRGPQALEALLSWMDSRHTETLTGSTAIMIAPGFTWKVVSRMVTNFHQPESTLLLLVSSFLDGEADPQRPDLQWKRIYSEALERDYMFLSYGDACLLSPLEPQVTLPGSKSISARALIADCAGGGGCHLEGLSDCADTKDMKRVLDAVRESVEHGVSVEVYAGEGGTTLRFALALAASMPGADVVLSGSPRLMERPLAPLVDALRKSGADIEVRYSGHGEPALHVRGRALAGGRLAVDSSVSSQFASALLLSAPLRAEDFTLSLPEIPVSAPYIDMTVEVMRRMGASVTGSVAQGEIAVSARGYSLPDRFVIEPDWSAASYFMEVMALNPSVNNRIRFSPPLVEDSLQGDSALRELMESFRKAMMCAGEWKVDFTRTPDLVPAMVAMACGCGVPFRFGGVANLRIKESDRLSVLAEGLGKLGYMLGIGDDELSWDGARTESLAVRELDPHGDHRMAMAFAPLVRTVGKLAIKDARCVNKSFPDFWTRLSRCGYRVEIVGEIANVEY
ncbi:MAG: S-adenosylmethionine:tRNA ribosyltransferase-isomerase [Muribaculaceae bacterium]|nr:S-adenosylmethionine:tRNA ribosyltransferase-isomerase [Muribaculaceae bacterium]